VLTNWTDGWLQVVNVQVPASPSEVGTGYDLPGSANHIWLSGTTAYVADGWGSGLQIIDLATPTAPTLLATYPSDNGTQDVCVVGSTAFVADREGGLVILDVSTPSSPSALATLDTGGEAYAVRVVGDHAYVAHLNGGLAAVSVATPVSPVLAGRYQPTGIAMDVFVDDGYLADGYVADGNVAGTSPAALGGSGSSGSRRVLPAYVADAEALWVLDLTDPANPVPLGAAELRDRPKHLSVSDGMAFVAESMIWNGVEIIDVSDARSPLVVGEFEPTASPGAATHVNDVHAVGRYAYVATASGVEWPPSEGALLVLDAIDPASPDQVAAHPTTGDARRVFVTDDVAYVGDGPGGLQLIDVSTPASPSDLGHLPPPSVAHATEAVCVEGSRAYVSHLSGEWPSYESTFQMVDVSNRSAPVVLDSYTIDGKYVSAHELGHTYGLSHVCSNQNEPFCGDYAYEGGRFSPTTGPSQGTTNYGYDVSEPKANLKIKKPMYPEMMTYAAIYAGDRWLSDFSWDTIRSKHPAAIPAASSAAVVANPEGYPYLLVCGAVASTLPVTETQDLGRLEPLYVVAGAVMQPLPSPGEYAVKLYDGLTLVASYPFDAQVDIHLGEESEELAPFTEVVPWQEGTNRVDIVRGETVLASRVASTNPPTVTLTYPEGGEVVTGTATITWLSGDADGDELEYAVLYSTDDGSTWQSLTSGWRDESFEFDALWLPGSDQARVRVLATDGMNTSMSTSPRFEVELKGPMPLIIMPEDGKVYPPGHLELQGEVLDLEDSEVTGSDLVWTDSVSSLLGSGEVLHVSDMSPGWHTLSLAATDSDGLTGTDSVTFLIGNYIWLPMVMRGAP